ncbi:hypothetical protein FA13DRAFT_1727451 [Coprinellus micaceus]|uniref:Anaphase-promoting complex subunit 5 n=1 Tax=Coprinellus micaceus TaxID=71717 RepID=A0A4Y7TP31_COPMI|nr:hypothetical protein FA13DRAFT_1727451 [Coprinellus micaceus]
MEDAPPPTEHILRPHHLVLLSILMIAFKDLEIKKFPPEFSTHLLRTLLNEVSEVTEPLTFRELMKTIASAAPSPPHRDVAQFMAAINVVHTDIYSTEKLGNFLTNLPQLFVDNPRALLEEKTRLARRSIFGYFCRRCFVSYVKLSYEGLSKLREDYQYWCSEGRKAGYETIPKDNLTTSYLIHKTQVDKKTWAKPDTYAAWEKARAVGDESVAVESIRSFFEQHFHDQSDSGFRQHALLNVVHMHYLNKEYVAAGKLLHEAIGVARTANDRPTLQHCLSLLRRLPPPPGVKPFLNEAQPDMHPFEVLYDVRKLLGEEHEQPISTAFNKFVEAVGLYDHWLEAHSAVPHADHQWAQHAVQSVIWREAGCERLAQASEEVVLSFTEPGSDNSTRLVVVLNKAHQMARQGRYHESLCLLLEPATWQGLTMNDHGSWAHEIWNILAMRAIRRGQERLYKEYLIPRKPAGESSSKHYTFEPAIDRLSPIRESLYQVLRLKNCDQLSNSVDALLNALWLSEFLGRYHAYRSAMILLADFGLQYGMPKRSKRILEDILPQVINGGDREQRAAACFTLARCLLVSEGTSIPVLTEALKYLKIAQADFEEMQMYSSCADVAYFTSVLYENLGESGRRDEAAKRHEEIESRRMGLEIEVLDSEVQEVWNVVIMVGTRLASR